MKSGIPTLVLTGALLIPSVALAWCRTTTCAAAKDAPAECTSVPGCQLAGTPLFWPKSCVSFSVQKDGAPSQGITGDMLQEVVETSFNNWQGVTCQGGGNPNMKVVRYAQVNCAESLYNQKGPNQNVWFFREDEWPHAGDGDRTIALTLVSFNPKTGEIYDVDVELNAVQRQFVLEPPTGTEAGEVDDLYSVVQHESGHFLGLAHSSDPTSTMWSNYNGSVDMRTLEADDTAGLCAAYPPTSTPDTSCDPEPRHGFSKDCTKAASDGCAMTRRVPGARPWGMSLLGVALAVALGRRRRRPSC